MAGLPTAATHEEQIMTSIMDQASAMIDITIPAVAIPAGIPTSAFFFLPRIPRTRPTMALAIPAYGMTSEHMPSTMEAIDKPCPGGFRSGIGGG